MIKLTRPEGTLPEDLHATRRGLGAMAFSGYALAAVAANAQEQAIHTDSTGLIAQMIRIPGPDQPIPCYVARPDARGKYPSLVVVSEVFGIHEYVRDVCRRLAKLGYVAIAPDFFFRAGNPAPLTDFKAIQDIVETATNAQVMDDMTAVGVWLERQPFTDRFGVVGFCWGGAVVWMAMAKFKGLRAGVAWYGRLKAPAAGQFLSAERRQWPIDVVNDLKGPVLGLYAGLDQGIPKEDVDEMNAKLAASGHGDSHIVFYPGTQHGFHADYRSTYNKQAAEDGWNRMITFLSEHGLAPRPPRRR